MPVIETPAPAAAGAPRSLGSLAKSLADEYGLLAMVLVAALTHAINMFRYPLYLGDEGIYMEQAWAVLRLGQLAPYTYIYDHAPAGWLLIALGELLLPRQFFTFGMAVNSGRVIMLLLDLGSVALLYRIAHRMSGTHWAAIATCLAFSLSPLAIYYQRMVLLDNIMVFWLLLCLDLLLEPTRRILPLLASGLCLGIATLSKENAIFFIPVLSYLIYQKVHGSYRFRFSVVGWALCAAMIISLYPLYAALRGELLPAGALVGNGTPAAHVSLISTGLWQMARHGTSVLDPNSQFWQYFWIDWWSKDPLLIVIGMGATTINLVLGLLDRERNRWLLVAGALTLSFLFYLMRGSVMIDFYVVPILPFFALNAGLLLGRVVQLPFGPMGAMLAAAGLVVMSVGFTRSSYFHDAFFVDQTTLQADQLRFVRENIPTSAYLLIDDDLWVDLHGHDGNNPIYDHADSHWKIAQDPAVYNKVLHNNWQNIDYLVLSNQLHYIFEENNEQMALTAYDHSRLMARFQEGNVELEVRQVIKNGPNG